jgi:hypothetical protein
MAQHPRQSFSAHYRQQQTSAGPPRPPQSSQSHPPSPAWAGDDDLPRPVYRPQRPRPASRKALVAGSSMVALAALWITPNLNRLTTPRVSQDNCLKLEQVQNFVSRDRLKKLLEIEPQAAKATVQEVLKEPYCVLEPTTGQADGPVEREAYPLEFDPSTWLVVLYNNDQYSGYDFSFRK